MRSESFPLKVPEPLLSQENKGRARARENAARRVDGYQETSGKSEGPQGDSTGQTIQTVRELLEIFAENIVTPSDNVGDIEPQKDPQ